MAGAPDIRLRAITWDHRRAIDPLVNTLGLFASAHPGIAIEWSSRPLHGFEFASVPELARDYDLIVFDHPFVGEVAATGCLLPLDGLVAPDVSFVGPSRESYMYAGRLWAVPIDAACQVAVSRPDLMARLDAPAPGDWSSMITLGRSAAVRNLRLAMALRGVHGLMTFFTLCANLGKPCGTEPECVLTDRQTARLVLAMLRELASLCPADCLDWNSIAVHDQMAARDDLVFCPAVYCYAAYAEADRRHPLRFHDLPGPRGHGGSTIGGTGLGVSSACGHPDAARAYARFAASAEAQFAFAGSSWPARPRGSVGRRCGQRALRRLLPRGAPHHGGLLDAAPLPRLSRVPGAGRRAHRASSARDCRRGRSPGRARKAGRGAIMRITDIEVIELRVPGWEGATFDGSYDDCVVIVHTDANVAGLAEVDSVPSVIRAIIEAPRSHTHAMGLKAALIGQDAADVEGLWDRMYDLTSYYGRRGVVIHALSAIDIALWDIRGKVAGKPVADLLGRRRRDRVLAYGTVYPLGDTPDEVRRSIDRGLKLGLKAIKIVADPFWRDDLARTEALIRAAREHVGPHIRLMVDAATAWATAEEGLPLMPLFRDHGFAWVEAPLPVDDLAGHARFQGFGVPIGGGDLGLTTRFEYAQMFDIGRIDIAQPDVTMAGGLTELMRIAELARARGKRVVTHGYKSNITIAANLAFLAQHWTDEPVEYSTSQSPLRWQLTRESFPIGGDGRIAVPEAPGLGVSLDPETVRKYRTG